MKYIGLIFCAMLAFAYISPELAWATAVSPDIAVPQGETELKVDLGGYVSWGASALFTGVLALWGVVKGVLPGPARWAIQVTQIDQVLEAKAREWIAKNADRLTGRASFTVDLRNEAVRDIAAMALNVGNKFVEKNRGRLIDMAHSRLEKVITEAFGSGKG